MKLFHRIDSLKIGMVAGEASGDLLGASLIEALKAQHANLEIVGIGGPLMQAAGLVSLFPQEALAVRGYIEVIKRLPKLWHIRRSLRAAFLKERPHVFIGVDAPDFNFGLELALKTHDIRTIHYVSPSLWAWRAERIHKIKRAVDHMLVLFPIEPPIYKAAGIPVTFVGHPRAQELSQPLDAQSARTLLQLPNVPLFTLLPGSRVSEIEYMAPLFFDTARKILAHLPQAEFIVPLATRPSLDRFDQLLRQHAADLPLRRLFGHSMHAMLASDLVIATSGTATLEVALARRPMVISYRVSNTTYRMVKHQLKLPYVGLPNILCGRFIVPEFLQYEATADNLAQAAINIWHDAPYRDWLQHQFAHLHHTLARDSAPLAAQAVLRVISGGPY